MTTRALARAKAQRKAAIERRALVVAVRAITPFGPSIAAPLLEPLFLRSPRNIPKKEDRARLETGHRFHIRHNGKKIAAWSWGDGPTIIGIHGWGGNAGNLSKWVAPLLARGFSVVLFDAPGHGESPGRYASPSHFADALTSVIYSVGTPYAVIGHSMGAAAAVIARTRGVTIPRLVLLGTPTSFLPFAKRFQESLKFSDRIFAAIQQRLEKRFRSSFDDLDLTKRAEHLDTPALFIHDNGDKETDPRAAEYVASRWKNAQFVPTDGLGHFGILRHTAVIERVLGFLAGAQRNASHSPPAQNEYARTPR